MRFLIILFLVGCTSAAAQEISNKIVVEGKVSKKIVKQWTNSVNKISTVNSTSYIFRKSGGKDSLHRSKHRSAIVWIPATTSLSEDLTVVFWFHGHWGYVPHRTFEDRTLKQFVPLTSSKNFVVVIPEMPWSVHTKTPTKRNSRLWTKSGDFLKFVDQVYSVLYNHNLTKDLGNIDYKVVGHSAGGSTIKRLGITGDLCKISPSMVVWSDSSYGNWLDHAWKGCLKNNPHIRVKVLVAKWDWPYKNATRFMKQFGKNPPEQLSLHVFNRPMTHKLIGNNAVKLSNLLGN
mgnify:CR=1 FL=1|tara:strand:- start:1018 stop:1884 length:867 start_codon:yes stop_codon:yes gene_type:complete